MLETTQSITLLSVYQTDDDIKMIDQGVEQLAFLNIAVKELIHV